MKIVFFGTPEFAVPPLQKLLSSGHEIAAVVTQPDRQSGRGRKLKTCPVKSTAENAGLKIIQPGRVRDPEFIKELRKLAPDLIVVVAYGQILPSEIIHLPVAGCLNIHASLLPKYRGAAPINWAVINGDTRTGITIMLMDEGMDTGPVFMQKEIAISPEDTAGSLSNRLSEMGADLLMTTLPEIENGSLKPFPQGPGETCVSLLKKSDGLIQWSKSSRELNNFIRGMDPWPGAYGFIEGERLRILKAAPAAGKGEPGKIEKATKDELYIGTGDGILSIIEIQPPGKPAMPVKAFLQGRKIKEGLRFDVSKDEKLI